MVFAIVKPVDGGVGKVVLCRLHAQEYLQPGDYVVYQTAKGDRIGRIAAPDFIGDVATVLDTWGLQPEDVKKIVAVMRRFDVEDGDEAEEDDGAVMHAVPEIG